MNTIILFLFLLFDSGNKIEIKDKKSKIKQNYVKHYCKHSTYFDQRLRH